MKASHESQEKAWIPNLLCLVVVSQLTSLKCSDGNWKIFKNVVCFF